MEQNILSSIREPRDLRRLSVDDLQTLSDEVRRTLIETTAKNGGHLASNLGTVELTIALHRVFDSPRDQIVFDVGHQCYTHKLLTGRYDRFSTLRTQGGLSGFCRPDESAHDVFYSGHSGTSVSAGLGLATAKKLQHDPHYVVSVIGDGSFTGGLVYEALNNGGRSGAKHILVLNDNNMSISENVGSLAKYLAVIRSTPQYYTFKASTERTLSKIPSIGKPLVQKLYDLKTAVKNRLYAESTFFEDLGYRYMGPIDGHNIPLLIDALEAAKQVQGPTLLHVLTKKGKGCPFAEENPQAFHGVSGFDPATGETQTAPESFSDRFGKLLKTRAERNGSLCAITAAMGFSTGLEPFKDAFSDRFFDVGIAEEHAVTFAAGLAKNKMIPVFAVYSTFLQRCYDQLVHDVALQKQKVIFAIDRAGFVGEDGETHQGLMDVPFLCTIPNLKIYAPCDFASLETDLDRAIKDDALPVAVRYPRGGEPEESKKLTFRDAAYALYGDENADTLLVTYGRLCAEAVNACDVLKEKGTPVLVLALNQIRPLPEDALRRMQNAKRVCFFEEGLRAGGVGERTALCLLENGFSGRYCLTAVPDEFVAQATVAQQLRQYGLDAQGMVETILRETEKTP